MVLVSLTLLDSVCQLVSSTFICVRLMSLDSDRMRIASAVETIVGANKSIVYILSCALNTNHKVSIKLIKQRIRTTKSLHFETIKFVTF